MAMDRPGHMLTFEQANHGECSLVRPKGTLRAETYSLLRDGLFKYAAEAPDAVLVDLDSLYIDHEHLLSVFSLVWMRVAEWPGVPIMIIASDEERNEGLRRSAIARYVPVHGSLAEALAAVATEPTRRRVNTALESAATAPGHARALVRESCSRWGVDRLTDDVQLVATELVENALKHTNVEPRLRLDLRRGLFTVAVTDDSPTEPVVREPSPHRDGGRGLRLIAELARAWGYTPTLNGGKVVWAVLSARDDNRVEPFFP